MQKRECTLRRMTWLLASILTLICLTAYVAVAYAILNGALWPEASGSIVQTKGSLTMDVSNAQQGYVMAKAESGSQRYKLRVSKGDVLLTYDLNSGGEYEVFPLQLGSGAYKFELYRNVEGKKYAQAGSIGVQVELDREDAAFLVPNQYVSYDENAPVVALSEEICAGLETDAQKLEAVRNYVVTNYVYDYVKAVTITAGTMPNIPELMEKRMGICQDIAAFTACALRVQGIPTQMVIGYADSNYHAWNEVLIDGEYQLVDLTAEINSVYRDVTYTVERYY